MTSLMSLLERVSRRFRHARLLIRLLLLKGVHGKRLQLSSLTFAVEPLTNLLIASGSKLSVGNRVYVKRLGDIEAHDGAHISFGDNVFINKNCSIVARFGINIGSHCMLGTNVSIFDHSYRHDKADVPFRDQGYYGRPITIGNNVWIGAGAFIGAGATIGDNAIIGAHATVTKDVAGNSVFYNKLTHTQVRLQAGEHND